MMLKQKRKRRTKGEMETYRQALLAIVEAAWPMTVRQVFYLATIAGHVPKTENGYDNVGVNLLHLRRSGRMPWPWITDGTRFHRKAKTYDSADAAVDAVAAHYRRDLWQDQNVHVEVWTEKDTLTGVIWEVINQWGVPLMVSKGFTSDSYLYTVAQDIIEADKPAYLYYLGDHDPSGVLIDPVIDRKLRKFAPRAEIHFQRIGVLPEQIEQWSLPTRPTKTEGNSHAKGFRGESVEVDAIHPDTLRELVRGCIEQHVDQRQLQHHHTIERSERTIMRRLASALRQGQFDEEADC